jgi:hypothetical protein
VGNRPRKPVYLHHFVRKAAKLLRREASSERVARSFDGLLSEIREAIPRYPESARATNLEQMLRTYRHFGARLFARYDHPDLPATNNGLEGIFRDTRRHERLITGHKSTARRTVHDGPFLVPALQRAYGDLPSAADLGKVPESTWRKNLKRIGEARARFDRPCRLRRDLQNALQDVVNRCRELPQARPDSPRRP